MAPAATLKLLSTTAMKTTLDEVVPTFERTSGYSVAVDYGPSASITKRIADGEAADLAIGTGHGIEGLIAQGKIVPASRTDLARSGMGVAVQKGAPKPDISTAEAFKAALLAAKSLGASNPNGGGASGAHLGKVLDQLGIADQLKSKTVYGRGGPAGLIGLFLLRGEADIGIQQIPELMAVPGIDIVGPLPPEIQGVTLFTAGLTTAARHPDEGNALIRFLAAAETAAVMKAKGFDPA
jgi:molybdate transport system substrate-binding protein